MILIMVYNVEANQDKNVLLTRKFKQQVHNVNNLRVPYTNQPYYNVYILGKKL